MYPYYVPATKDTSYWQLDKPCLVGELPADGGFYFTPSKFMDLSFDNDFIGNAFWVGETFSC